MPFVWRDLVCACAYDTTFLCGLCRVHWRKYGLCTELVAGGTPRCSVPFQFDYVSTTVVPLSIIESTNSLCTEPLLEIFHIIPLFQFIRIAKVQKWWVAKSLFVLILNVRENVAKESFCSKEIKIDENNFCETSHALPISLCKKECKQVWKKVFKKNSGIMDGKKRIETSCWHPMQCTSVSLVHFWCAILN